MYYSGSELEAYSYAAFAHYGLIFVGVGLLLAAFIVFLVGRFTKKRRKSYRASIILLVIALVFGLLSASAFPKPRCCGEGYTLAPITWAVA